MKINCKHILDKNHKYCIRCGCKVISETLRPATPEEQKQWRENPQELLKGQNYKLTE